MPATRSRPRKKKRPGMAQPVRTETFAVHGTPEPDRVLTVDFSRFVDALAATPDPRTADVAGLSAGSDLLLGIMEGDLVFEKAAPAASAGADLADRILALTDDAFEYAHRILEQDAYNIAYHENEDHKRLCEMMQATLTLLDYTDDAAVFRSACSQLLAREGAEDAAAARELL